MFALGRIAEEDRERGGSLATSPPVNPSLQRIGIYILMGVQGNVRLRELPRLDPLRTLRAHTDKTCKQNKH